jgi:hypothetical protein
MIAVHHHALVVVFLEVAAQDQVEALPEAVAQDLVEDVLDS